MNQDPQNQNNNEVSQSVDVSDNKNSDIDSLYPQAQKSNLVDSSDSSNSFEVEVNSGNNKNSTKSLLIISGVFLGLLALSLAGYFGIKQLIQNSNLEIPGISSDSENSGTSAGDAKIKANDTKRKADLKRIQSFLEQYYSIHYIYPTSLDELAQYFAEEIPTDPTTEEDYSYFSIGSSYELSAKLESKNDNDPNYDSETGLYTLTNF